jgi:hypothetical protein
VRAVLDDEVEVRGSVGEPGGEVALVGLGATVSGRVAGGERFPAQE